MASQKTSQSSSSSGSSLELQQHQPSFDQQQRGSSGSFTDQPGPSGLQAGPSGLQDEISIPFPSQDLDDFDMMMRDEGASTHQYPTGRRDAGARSGQLSYGNRDAEVPYTEISSQTEVSDHEGDGDTVVPSQPDSQQSRLNVLQQGKVSFTDSGSLSDVSQASCKVPSLVDSTSTTSDYEQKKKKSKKNPENVGVDFSPQMMCSISSSSGSSGSNSFGSQSQCKQQSLSGSSATDSNTSDSSVDPASTTSASESGSSTSQDSSSSSSEPRSRAVAKGLTISYSTSQNISTLNFSQPQEDLESYHVPATPDSMELPSISSDVISSTPDTDIDGSSQELISSTPAEIEVARNKRDRSYDGDDDASSLDEAPKRRKLSPLVTSTSISTTSASTPSPKTNETEFKTPSWPPALRKSKSGSSSGGSTVTSSSGSSTPYPSSCGTSSSGVGQSSSSSDVDSAQVETILVPAVQTMPQLETSKEDLKDVSSSSQDATLELLDPSQSMDATVSLDMIGETVPQSFPADDNEFNLHLSNTTTATQCSAASQDLEESQVESQTAATSSSSSSEQTVESTPTPDDHVTSPSPSPDDNDDGAAGGRGSDAREPEDNQDEEKKDKTQDSKNDDKNSGGNGKQQEESEVMQLPSTDTTQDTTSSVDMTILESNDQLKDKEENSCIIVESLLSSEPVHQINDTTSSEFELGITAAPSNTHQTIVDSPIKVPKVTEQFSQDTFSSLNIQSPDISNGMPPIHPISSMRQHSTLLETVRVATSTESTNDSDPFEFNSQDETEVVRKKKTPKQPSKIPTTQIDCHDNQKVTDNNSKETVTELLDEESEKQPPIGKKSLVADKHSPVMDDEDSLVIDERSSVPGKQPPVAMHLPVTDEPSPICVEDLQSAVADNQSSVAEQLPVMDNQLLIIEDISAEDPVGEKQSSVTKQLPVIDSRLPIAEEVTTGDQQLPVGDNQAPIAKQVLVTDNQLSIVEQMSAEEQQLSVGKKQSPLSNTRVVNMISCDVNHHLHEQLSHLSEDDNDECLAMEVEHNSGDITPSEHGQVVDLSSEDPLNSIASRSEMASTAESSPRTFSDVVQSQERHSRTTIYTTKTVIIKKSYIEEQLINDQWVTTDEYQEELDPVVEESEEMIMKCVKSYPPKTVPFQDTSISSSFTTSSTPKAPQRTSVRRRHNTSTSRGQRALDASYSSQARPNRTENDSPTVTQEETSSSRIGQVTPQLEVLQCADDRVLARWKDAQWYPGTTQENLSNGKYAILFDDGDKKVLAKSSVIQMSLLRIGSEVMVLTEDDDYLRGSITGRCTVDDEPGYLVNTGGREPLRCPESDLKLTHALVKQLTSTGPSPAASPAVRSKRNLLTTPVSSKKRRTNSSPTVSTSGSSSSLLLCELSFVITGEGKTTESLGDQIVASGGIVLSEFPTDVCPSKTFLLADKPRRTAKYLLALAGGVPCIRPLWAKDCLKQNRLLDYKQYLLPAGQCSKTNKMIPWSPREPKTILSRLKILLKGSSSFKKFWEPIIMAAGGRIVSRLSYSNESGDDCDLVLCQEGTSGETLRRAQNLQLPCIDVEWAIQCLITGEQLDHSSFGCT